MTVAHSSFTVHGTPSDDGYGGSFEYTHPAPLVPSVPADRASPMVAVGFSPVGIAFCVVMNMAALMLLLLVPKPW